MKSILLIAGTADARLLAGELAAAGHRVVASVATPLGAELMSTSGAATVLTGRKDGPALGAVLRQLRPDCLVDASHPFAEAVSRHAIAACAEHEIRYLRFERPRFAGEYARLHRVADHQSAAAAAAQIVAAAGGRALLTVGSSQLEVYIRSFADPPRQLCARVLPLSAVLSRCEELGLGPGRIIAAQGPFSADLNLATIHHVDATVLVSKDSGEVGGLAAKVAACAQAGIDLVLIERPVVAYPIEFADRGELIKHLEGEA